MNTFATNTTNHPRPDFSRTQWQSLVGQWDLFFDDIGSYTIERVIQENPFNKNIAVPYTYQSELSTVQDSRYHPIIWYRKKFSCASDFNHILLHFGAIDYYSTVWVNGNHVGNHCGGYDSFFFPLTRNILEEQNELIIKVEDYNSKEQVRGKQTWSNPAEVWYTAISGIWQPVWLEYVGDTYIKSVHSQTSTQSRTISLNVTIDGEIHSSQTISMEVLSQGILINSISVPLNFPCTSIQLSLPSIEMWSIDKPHLYDLLLSIHNKDTNKIDEVSSYVAFRDIQLKREGFYLNGKLIFLNFVLDQGYWEKGLYTPDTIDGFRQDIELAKRLGFNGCRKHMKIENPLFLYWADRLGFLIWEEAPAYFSLTSKAKEQFLTEWASIIFRDKHHPSVITWVPFNESWGLPCLTENRETQYWLHTISNLTKLWDSTRPVVDNDGWEHLHSDIVTYHDYSSSRDELLCGFESVVTNNVIPFNQKTVSLVSNKSSKRPVMISEYGGVAFTTTPSETSFWGYGEIPNDSQKLYERLLETIQALTSMNGLIGACYTQLVDVEQEKNGLCTIQRIPKLPAETFFALFSLLKSKISLYNNEA